MTDIVLRGKLKPTFLKLMNETLLNIHPIDISLQNIIVVKNMAKKVSIDAAAHDIIF